MNWDERDFWMLVLQGLTLFVALCSLGATIFFTTRLVKNDDNRERRAEVDRNLTNFKKMLNGSLSRGNYNNASKVGLALAKQFPKDVWLILSAYSQLVFENEYPAHHLFTFKETLKKEGFNIDNS